MAATRQEFWEALYENATVHELPMGFNLRHGQYLVHGVWDPWNWKANHSAGRDPMCDLYLFHTADRGGSGTSVAMGAEYGLRVAWQKAGIIGKDGKRTQRCGQKANENTTNAQARTIKRKINRSSARARRRE